MKLRRLITTTLFVVAGIASTIVVGVFWLLHTPTPAPEARLAPAVAALNAPAGGQPRIADAAKLLDWAGSTSPLALVHTVTDQLPNGLALSMVPFLVDWDASTLDGSAPFVLVRNVNAGGNPIAGDNLLATAKVPLDGVDQLQWCLTPTRKPNGKDSFMGHAMLRFVFTPSKRPQVLDQQGAPLTRARPIDDLMLSWEAWRPPLTRYDGLKGLDPASYALTARAYSGRQRFLTDVVRGNPWKCWPIRLPAFDDAVAEALVTALLIGDAQARHFLQTMVDDGSLQLQDADALKKIPEPELERAAAVFSVANLPKDPLTALVGKTALSYQLLERSCITESLTVVQLALQRIHARYDLGPAPRMAIVPTSLPKWLNDLATADTGTLLSHIPGALVYVALNPHVIPSRSYEILSNADLLVPGPDGPLMYYYDKSTGTPYGDISDNLM